MPRGARVVLPDIALHLVQRGINRGPCFFSERHYADYLELLACFAKQFGCSIHAYCLMTNHVHLLLTPHHRGACARVMKQLNQCYVQRLNKSAGRTGTLWEGRFHSGLVASDGYALACYRYIELNPVRAGLSAHATYAALSESPERRGFAYRAMFDYGLQETEMQEIRKATRGGYRIGERRRPRGRPPRQESRVRPLLKG